MLINPDFRLLLEQVDDDTAEHVFHPLMARGFELSVQPRISVFPGPGPTPEVCDRWDVALRGEDRIPANPATHPQLFPRSAWRQYWLTGQPGAVTASNVPTEVVQTLFDFLVLGPELYGEMTSMR